MTFHEQLSAYMDEYNITVHELASACGESDAVISRYKNGYRTPREDGAIRRIAEYIADRASSEPFREAASADDILTADDVYMSLYTLLPNAGVDRDSFTKRANALMESLHFNISSFAKSANYDPSFISRVFKGQRSPSDYHAFAEQLASYAASCITSHSDSDIDKDSFEALTGIKVADGLNTDELMLGIKAYLMPDMALSSASAPVQDDALADVSAGSFLEKIDSFDLNEYMHAIHFDKLKVPTLPSSSNGSKRYYGEKGMKDIETDFLRVTALAPDRNPVYMYSTVPMEPLTRDMRFAKRWMLGLASVLKKGHDIHMIHDLGRPFSELMAGLESWIPLYMTGQIHSYYMPRVPDPTVRTLIRVSDTAAAWGECIGDDLSTAGFYMTKSPSERSIYMKRAQTLFDNALPLIDNISESADFDIFLNERLNSAGAGGVRSTDCHRLMSVPPLHTLTPVLLSELAAGAGISDEDTRKALEHLDTQKKIFDEYTRHSTLHDSFPRIDKKEFDSSKVYLALSGAFLSADIPYTYDIYLRHVGLTLDAAARNPRYKVYDDDTYPFRNIQITVSDDGWALVSKNTAPTIHFVIRHPILVDAIRRFSPPI